MSLVVAVGVSYQETGIDSNDKVAGWGEDEDIVAWHNFGHSHVCKPEDFAILPVEYAGFILKPNNFFAASPAMYLARRSQ